MAAYKIFVWIILFCCSQNSISAIVVRICTSNLNKALIKFLLRPLNFIIFQLQNRSFIRYILTVKSDFKEKFVNHIIFQCT